MKVFNQFLLTSKEVTNRIDDFSQIIIGKYTLYAERSLNISVKEGKEFSMTMIGFCFNWRAPHDRENEIISKLCKVNNIQHILEEASNLSGVYILLVWNKNELFIIPDTCSLRELYYTQQNEYFLASSSPHLLQVDTVLELDDNHPVYTKPDFSAQKLWIGNETLYKNVRRLKPNHYLLIGQESFQLVRFFPTVRNIELSVEDAATAATTILKGLFTAVAARGSAVMGLTAGWDSRVLLAASREVRGSILYSVVERARHDYSVSRKLAKTLDLNHAVFRFCNKPDQFKFDYLKDWLSNFDSKNPILNLLQYFPKLLTINGVCSEIGRNFYGINNTIDGKILAGFAGHPENEYCITYYKKWLEDNVDLFSQTGYQTLDMFYWEEVLANRAAKELSERNALNNINYAPFNCRILISTILSTNPLARETQNNTLYLQIINQCWPQVLTEPINPDPKKRIISFLQKIGIYNIYRSVFPSGIFEKRQSKAA